MFTVIKNGRCVKISFNAEEINRFVKTADVIVEVRHNGFCKGYYKAGRMVAPAVSV